METFANGKIYSVAKDKHGWTVQVGLKYLQSISKGTYTLTTDYLYARHYTTEYKARRIMREMIKRTA